MAPDADAQERHIQVPIFDHPDYAFFRDSILTTRKPALLRNLDVGSCITKWTPEHLVQTIGPEKLVSVHESTSNRLRFLNKNFTYKTLPFETFIRCARDGVNGEGDPGYFYYYRAVADDARKEVSDFRRDFAGLVDDFSLGHFLDPDSIFSCVLRIGSMDLGLWLHYDVLDNVLVQVRGKKRAILFDPEEFDYLYLHGDKSRIHDPENVDLEQFPLFDKAQRWVCTMGPGDILFIPAFWMHYMVCEEFSIAVNVFWYNLPRELYDSRDTYGNKDLLPFTRASQGLDKALKQLDVLPEEVARFYARMLKSRIDKYLEKKLGDL